MSQAQKQEPVAWRYQSAVGGWAYGKEPPIGSKYAVEPLYTTPPQRQPLTDEEIQIDFDLWWYHEGSGPMLTPDDCEEHTRRMCEIAWKKSAYKAAHGIKEKNP